jgi:septal ring factor EnvC (AmiA/AmiB activator)
MSRSSRRSHRLPLSSSARLIALAAVLLAIVTGATVLGPVAAGSSGGTLEGRIAASEAREGELHSGIGADTHQIEGFQGSIDDLQTRLDALESSLDTERNLLASLRSQLRTARANLASLQVQLGRDRQVLVAQVIASYESPPPDIVTVVLEAHGFADLLERLDEERAISRENAGATVHVAEEQKAVTAEASNLATLEASHARETSAVLVQRDEVAQLHLALVSRQVSYIRARDQKSAELAPLESHRHSLEGELSKLAVSELAAEGVANAYTGPVGNFTSAPQGEYGFFQAPGTDYSVGEEPVLVAHLNTLGIALHLHLIGISGYRTPEHSAASPTTHILAGKPRTRRASRACLRQRSRASV